MTTKTKCPICMEGTRKDLAEYLIGFYRETLFEAGSDDANLVSRISEGLNYLLRKVCEEHKGYLATLASYLKWWVVYTDNVSTLSLFAKPAPKLCAACIAYPNRYLTVSNDSYQGKFTLVRKCGDPRQAICPLNDICAQMREDLKDRHPPAKSYMFNYRSHIKKVLKDEGSKIGVDVNEEVTYD